MGNDADDLGRARLARLYDEFAPALFRTACGLLGSTADAEDAVHDVFLAVARGQARLPAVADLRAYLFTALRHAAARRGRRRWPESLAADPVDHRAPPERDDALEQALARLPAEQREVIALKIDGGLTFAELAAVLGISPNTAASRYRYALAKLRADLERDPVTPTDPFDDLEARLRRRPLPALPPALRDRVLANVTPVPADGWRFAAGLAAAVLVGLNLALMAANGPLMPRFALAPGAEVVPRFGCPWLPCDLPGGR